MLSRDGDVDGNIIDVMTKDMQMVGRRTLCSLDREIDGSASQIIVIVKVFYDDSSDQVYYDNPSCRKLFDDSSCRKFYDDFSQRKFYDDSSCRKFFDDPSYSFVQPIEQDLCGTARRVLITSDFKDMMPSFSAAIKAAVESVDEEEDITDEEPPEEEDDDGPTNLEEDMSKFKPESTELSKENIRASTNIKNYNSSNLEYSDLASGVHQLLRGV